MKKLFLTLITLLAFSGVSWGKVTLGTLGSPFDPSTLTEGQSKQFLMYAAGCAEGKAAIGYLKCTSTSSTETNLPGVSSFSSGDDIEQYIYTIKKFSDYYEITDCNGLYVMVFPGTSSGYYGNAASYSSSTTYKGDLTLSTPTSYDNAIATGSNYYVYNISSKTATTGYLYHDGSRTRADASGDVATAPAAIQFVPFEATTATITYTVTDVAGNDYSGSYVGYAGITMPTFTGVTGVTYTNVVWNDATLTATINFPFKVSKTDGTTNWIYISSNGTAGVGVFYYYVDGTNVKVQKAIYPTNGNNTKYEWAVYPTLNGSAFSFKIKNNSTGTYLYSANTADSHNEGTVVVSSTGSDFTFNSSKEWVIGTRKLSVNTRNSNDVQNVGVWTNSHYGTYNTISNATDFDALKTALTTAYNKALTYPIGTGLGKYAATDAFSAAKTASKPVVEGTEYFTAAQFTSNTTALAISNLTLNLPQSGSCFRIQSVRNPGYYLSNVNHTATGVTDRAAFVNSADVSTIYYYVDGKLTAYDNGSQIGLTSSNMPTSVVAGTASDITITASTYSSDISKYSIKVGTNRQMYCYDKTISGVKCVYADAAGSGASEATGGYAYTLEEVTELPLEISTAGWATFSAPVGISGLDGAEAYYVDQNNTSSVRLASISDIPANTGVILKGSAKTYNLTIGAASSTVSDNLLKPAVAAQNITADDGNTAYIFTKVGENVGFYKMSSSSTIAGHKAWLELPTENSIKEFIGFDNGDETAISTIATATSMKDGKFMENGKIVIVKNGVKYNVAGQMIK